MHTLYEETETRIVITRAGECEKQRLTKQCRLLVMTERRSEDIMYIIMTVVDNTDIIEIC